MISAIFAQKETAPFYWGRKLLGYTSTLRLFQYRSIGFSVKLLFAGAYPCV